MLESNGSEDAGSWILRSFLGMAMRPKHIAAVCVSLMLAFAAIPVAHAGKITEFECTFVGGSPAEHWWHFNYEVQKLGLYETRHGIGDDLIGMSGDISLGGLRGTTVFHVTKTVENMTGAAWIAYQLTMEGCMGSAQPLFIVGTAYSDKMTCNCESPSLLQFAEPQLIPSGDCVTFDFDIAIPEGCSFDFVLRQTALAPEPATILLMGGGGWMLVRRR